MFGQVIGDRGEQMGLAESGRAMKEERVVGLARRLGDGERRRMGEPVAVADHEATEHVLRV